MGSQNCEELMLMGVPLRMDAQANESKKVVGDG